MLLNKRLDLDIAKTRLRKAHEAEQESRVSYNDDNRLGITSHYHLSGVDTSTKT